MNLIHSLNGFTGGVFIGAVLTLAFVAILLRQTNPWWSEELKVLQERATSIREDFSAYVTARAFKKAPSEKNHEITMKRIQERGFFFFKVGDQFEIGGHDRAKPWTLSFSDARENTKERQGFSKAYYFTNGAWTLPVIRKNPEPYYPWEMVPIEDIEDQFPNLKILALVE